MTGFGDTLSRVALHVAVSVGQLALSVALLPWETLVFLYMLLIDSNPLLASGHGGQAAGEGVNTVATHVM